MSVIRTTHCYQPLTWLCVLCVSCGAFGAPAATSAATAWDLVSPRNFDWHVRGERVAIANDLQSRVDRLADLVTVQTPAEIEKLSRDEAKLTASNKSDQATAELQLTVAYQHRKLANLLAEISASLNCVIKSETEAAEMHCWALASLLLGDQDAFRLALATLRDQRRVPQNKNLPPLLRGPEVWYETYARGVLEIILIPYLAEAAKPKSP